MLDEDRYDIEFARAENTDAVLVPRDRYNMMLDIKDDANENLSGQMFSPVVEEFEIGSTVAVARYGCFYLAEQSGRGREPHIPTNIGKVGQVISRQGNLYYIKFPDDPVPRGYYWNELEKC